MTGESFLGGVTHDYYTGLYNITIIILRALIIKLTQARARVKAMARARDRASSRARAWERVYAPGPFLQADQI